VVHANISLRSTNWCCTVVETYQSICLCSGNRNEKLYDLNMVSYIRDGLLQDHCDFS